LSVRFERSGRNLVRDHNELNNKGIHTHAEIDPIVDEVIEARKDFISLNARLDSLETGVHEDFKITGVIYDAANNSLNVSIKGGRASINNNLIQMADTTYIVNAPSLNTDYYLFVKDDGTITSAGSIVESLTTMVIGKVSVGNDLTAPTYTDLRYFLTHGGGIPQELIDARGTYVDLKHRLDAADAAIAAARSEADSNASAIAVIQQKQAADEQDITIINNTIASIQQKQTTDEQNIANNTNAIASIQQKQTADEQNIATNTQNISSLQSEVTAARGTFTDLKSRLDDMTSKIGTGGGGTGGGSGLSFRVESLPNTRSGSQTVFTIPAYTPGSGLLFVYRDGVLLSSSVDYVETDSTTVTFNTAVPVDAIITFVCFK
jgi:ubiquinone biosynthesis protein UbiJ